MPFESCFGLIFNAVSIGREAPAASGVYGLSNSRRWLYIAESENIRASLLAYLKACGNISEDLPAGFSFELSPAGNRTARRDRLIAELTPLQNPIAADGPRHRGRG